MSTSQVQLLIQAQDNATKEIKRVSGELNRLSATQSKLNKKAVTDTNNFRGSILSVGTAIKGIAVLMAGKLAKAMITSASSMEQAGIAFETMVGNAREAQALLKQVSVFAEKTPFDLPEVVSGAKNLLAYGVATQNILPTLKALGDVSAGLSVDLNRLILNYGQVKTQTKLTGMEMRDFLRAGVPLISELAKNLDVSESKIKEMVSAGKVGFKDVEKAFQTMTGEGGRFKDLMERQSKSLSGTLSNLRDVFFRLGATIVGVSETGQVMDHSLFQTLINSSQQLLKELDKNKIQIMLWGNALIQGFTWVFRTIFNVASIIIKSIVGALKAFVSVFIDAFKTVQNVLDGDFSVSTETTSNAVSDMEESIKTDMFDMKDAFTDSFVSVENQFNNYGDNLELAGQDTKDFADDAESEMSKAEASMVKKIDAIVKKFGKLKKAYKENKKDLKESFKEEQGEDRVALAEGIAGELLAKEEEVRSLTDKIYEAETEDEKEALIEQQKNAQAFLDAHLADQIKYAEDIKELRDFNDLDVIEQMKAQFEKEQEEKAEQYKEDKKELKKRYKEQKEDLKDQLKDLIKEMEKFEGSSVFKRIAEKFSALGIKADNDHKQFGGSVQSGQSYVVGEHRPEVFVPSQSGNIKQVEGGGGKEVNINFNNVNVRSENDLRSIIGAVKQALKVDNLKAQYGIRT